MALLSNRDTNLPTTFDRDDLSVERLTVLKEIHHIEQIKSADTETMRSMDRLRQRYNCIIGSIDNLNAKPRHDPLDRLPVELFRAIIHETLTPSNGRPHEYPYDSNQALLLTLVSTRWRDFILEMPSAWTSIQINYRLPDCLAKIALCLTLSRDLPIHLNLTFPMRLWDSILPMIAGHKERIQRISLYYYWPWKSPPSSGQIEVVLDFLEELLPMPNLQRLSTCSMDNRGDAILLWLLDHCNHLQATTGLSFREDMLHLDSVRELRKVHIPVKLERFMSLEANTPMLAQVELVMPPKVTRKQSRRGTIPISPPHPNVSPLSWRYLSCWYPNPETLTSLIPRLTDLKELTLGVGDRLLKALLAHIYQFYQLEYLSLDLDTTKDKSDVPFSMIKVQTNNRVVVLRLKVARVDSKDSTPLASTPSSIGLSESLARVMPGLQEISLTVPATLDVSPLYEGRGLPKLSKINLYITNSDTSLQHYYEAAPSLRNIHIRSSPMMWTHFTSSHATQMKFSKKNVPFLISSFPNLDFRKWPALHVLSIFERCLLGQDLQLLYLRELEIRRETPFYEDLWLRTEGVTRFCKELAMFPSRLPSLERLKLWGIPHWDVLVLMLKKRNITTSSDISPIRYLTIRDSYPKELTRPIIALLQGKFPQWWPLYDVSIHNAFNIISNQSM
ncbi:hypothetical protein CPB86DRAFT_815383 [Serendipita vermifera]|nr:hypothetical protein CPB86DRAFT_815383 [Serendipita vermifera]